MMILTNLDEEEEDGVVAQRELPEQELVLVLAVHQYST